MRLTKARISKYKSIKDSTPFRIEPDVTSLVGKNESGKTAILQSMYKACPAEKNDTYDLTLDYPAHLGFERTRIGKDQIVAELTYELEDDDLHAIEQVIGPGTVQNKTVTYQIPYEGTMIVNLKIDKQKVTNNLLNQLDLPEGTRKAAAEASTPKELVDILEEKVDGDLSDVQKVKDKVNGWRDSDPLLESINILTARRPRFVYYMDYDIMPGMVSVPNLIQKRDAGQLTRGEQALVAFIKLAGITLEDLCDTSTEHSEELIRELESASNTISDEVFEYWSQNKELSLVLSIIPGDGDARDITKQGPLLQVRVRNERHRVTVKFDERSRGFIWFFSFLAYFSEMENQSDQPLILLLDEPGLSLHATAQHDLLRFIHERLAPQHQVIFTTHSPFMIDAHKFNQVRTVIDEGDKGTVVSEDVLKADSESTFPLYAAMGVELTQTLFIGPYVLFVEGPSDFVFLNFLSNAVVENGGKGLDERWTITPGGGLAKIPIFLNLFGANHITMAVLTDSSERDKPILGELHKAGRVFKSGLVSIGDVTGQSEADIEDIFEPRYYLNLVNIAYAGALHKKKLQVKDLPEGDRIVKRVEQYFKSENVNNGHLNHYSPAAVLMRDHSELPELSEKTLAKAEKLFDKINMILSNE